MVDVVGGAVEDSDHSLGPTVFTIPLEADFDLSLPVRPAGKVLLLHPAGNTRPTMVGARRVGGKLSIVWSKESEPSRPPPVRTMIMVRIVITIFLFPMID